VQFPSIGQVGMVEINAATDISSSPRRLRHSRSSKQWSALDAMTATRLGLDASVSLKSMLNRTAACGPKSRSNASRAVVSPCR
jgi:hypothetical protein